MKLNRVRVEKPKEITPEQTVLVFLTVTLSSLFAFFAQDLYKQRLKKEFVFFSILSIVMHKQVPQAYKSTHRVHHIALKTAYHCTLDELSTTLLVS